MVYITLLCLGCVFLYYSFRHEKKRLKKLEIRRSKNGWLSVFEYLGAETIISKLIPKKNSRSYKKIERFLMDNYLERYITVESYSVIKIIFAIILFLIVLNAYKISSMVFGYATEAISRGVLLSGGKAAVYGKQQKVFIVAILIAVLGYSLSDLIFAQYGKYKKNLFSKELLIIEIYMLMLLRAKMQIKDILMEISQVSASFKQYFLEAVASYSVDPEKTLNQLADRVPDKEFRNVIRLLNSALIKDDKHVVTYLRRHIQTLRVTSKEKRKKQADLIDTMSSFYIIIPYILLFMWGIYPWLVYTIKNLSNL